MKKYYLFAGSDYYPGGGMSDCVGGYDDVREAHAVAVGGGGGEKYPWWHVVDVTTMQVVLWHRNWTAAENHGAPDAREVGYADV